MEEGEANKPQKAATLNGIKSRVDHLEETADHLDRNCDKLFKNVSLLSERVAVRESSISPISIQEALAQIKLNTRELEDVARRFNQLSKDEAADIAKLETMLKQSSRYWAIISPSEIQKSVEELHYDSIELTALKIKFEEFVKDRVVRLEETNKQIDSVRDLLTTAETRIIRRMEESFKEEILRYVDSSITVIRDRYDQSQKTLNRWIITSLAAIAFLFVTVFVTIITHTFGSLP